MRIKDEWALYEKIVRPDPDVRLRVHQAWHAGAVTMFTQILEVLREDDEGVRVKRLKQLGQDAGDALLSTVNPGRLQQALYELMGGPPQDE